MYWQSISHSLYPLLYRRSINAKFVKVHGLWSSGDWWAVAITTSPEIFLHLFLKSNSNLCVISKHTFAAQERVSFAEN